MQCNIQSDAITLITLHWMAEQKTSISCRVRSVLEIWLEDGADCDDNSSICDSI